MPVVHSGDRSPDGPGASIQRVSAGTGEHLPEAALSGTGGPTGVGWVSLARPVGIVADEGEGVGLCSRGQLVKRRASNGPSFGGLDAMGAPLRSEGTAGYVRGREEASDPMRRVSGFGGTDGGAKQIRGRCEAEARDRDKQYRATDQGAPCEGVWKHYTAVSAQRRAGRSWRPAPCRLQGDGYRTNP
jgi:hypothetical protein